MRKRLPFWLVMAVCAAALVASAILLVDYVRPAPVFCAAEGGCGVVRRSAFAYPFGVPTPLIGLGGFLAIGLAQLLPGRRARLAQVALAGFGGAAAAAFIAIQISLKTFCPYCAVADVAALLLLGLSVLRLSRGTDPPEQKAHLAAAVLAVVVAVGAPIGFGMTRKAIPASVPAVIAEEMQKTARGKVTVVDFVDFECPFCRMTHAELSPLLAARKDKVRVARKHVPLRMHAHAMDAARTACCAERLGKGDEMAEALFTADPVTLTPEGCEALALAQGLDVPRFRECVKDPATEARILADTAAFRAAHGQGLPTLYIDGTVLEGAQDREALAATLDSAIKGL